MKRVFPYLITACLLAIVILQLIRNKNDINAQIAFAEKKVTAYPVRVEVAQLGTMEQTIQVTAPLEAAAELMLMAETQGRVQNILRQEGDAVAVGDLLARVDDTLMRQALEVTKANYEKALKDLNRATILVDSQAITQQQYEGLKLQEQAALSKYQVAQKRVADAAVRAPISGIINQLFIKPGGMIGPGVPVCELVNINSLKMKVKVDEAMITKINKGQHATISVKALPGIVLDGTVVSLAAKADYALQYTVGLVIDHIPDPRLRAGMVATATFQLPDNQPGVILPAAALSEDADHPTVFVIHGKKAILIPVTLLSTNDKKIKVEGLHPGDTVVTAGQFNLPDSTRVIIQQSGNRYGN